MQEAAQPQQIQAEAGGDREGDGGGKEEATAILPVHSEELC